MAVHPPVATAGEADTCMRVLRFLLERPSATAADIAEDMGLTGAAVRRHLHHLKERGYAEPAPVAKPTGGRGRPAAAWRITPTGRGVFGHSYDELARQALEALQESGGEEAVVQFARRRARKLLAPVLSPSPQEPHDGMLSAHQVEIAKGSDQACGHSDSDGAEGPAGVARPLGRGVGQDLGLTAAVSSQPPAAMSREPCCPAPVTIDQVAEAFRQAGYSATVEYAGNGVQLCQHHCPVSQVARDFPQLCDAEAEVISELMGRPVQSLATIPAGNGVCTTNIPPPA